MRPMIIALSLAFAATAHAEQARVSTGGAGAAWAPQQATGAPDCSGGGDQQQAWATLQADSGLQWLELSYDRAVPVSEVRIFENHNPGAVVKIEAMRDGEAVVIWQGEAPRKPEPHVFVAQAQAKATTDRIRVTLDTARISGWNEIDAVELVGEDGSRQWATGASASSTYAAAGGGGGVMWSLIGRAVRVRVAGETLTGKLEGIEGGFLKLKTSGGLVLINQTQVGYITERR